jgi:hypothetical protein
VPEVGAERWPGGERRKARAASEHRKVTRYQRLDLLEVVLRVRAERAAEEIGRWKAPRALETAALARRM